MAGGLDVSVSADITDLQSKLAVAQQVLRDYQTEMKNAAKVAAQSSDEQRSALTAALGQQVQQVNAAKAAVSALNQELSNKTAAQAAVQGAEQVASSHGHMAGSAGVTREVLVMLHETMMGNYNRLAGSTVVLAERTNLLHRAIMALTGPMGAAVAGAAALAGGLAYLAIEAAHTESALRGVYNAALLQGRNALQAEGDTRKHIETMRDSGVVGHKAATEIVTAIQSIPHVADDVRGKLAAIAPALFEVWDRDAERTAKGIDQAFKSIGSLSAFLKENDLLVGGQHAAFAAAEASKDAFAAQRIGVDALTARLGPAFEAFKKQSDASKAFAADIALAGEGALTLPSAKAAMLPPIRMPALGSQAEDEGTRRQTEATERYNTVARERLQIEADIGLLKQRITASSGEEQHAAMAALADAQAKLNALTSASQSAAYQKVGQDARDAANAAVTAAAAAHKTRTQISEAELIAQRDVYEAASRDSTLSEHQRTEAKAEATRLNISLTKEEARTAATGASDALKAAIASYDQQIAAAHGNAVQVIALEHDKLAAIRAAKGESSAIYQEALKHETEAVNAAVQQQFAAMESAGKRRIAQVAAEAKEVAAYRQSTKAEEIAAVIQAVETEQRAELQQADTVIASLTEGTLAYKTATDARLRIAQQFKTELTRLHAEETAAGVSSATAVMRAYDHAFSGVGSTGTRAIEGLVTGQMTFQRASGMVAQSVLSGFIGMTTTMVGRWVAKELAQSAISSAATAQRVATEQAAGNIGFGALIARWIGLEGAKTTATTGGAAARATAETSGGFFSVIGTMLAEWLGLETAKTGGTVAQVGARTAIEDTSAASQLVETLTTNVAGAESYAAVGAAAAGSSVAAIPYVGWAMAPGVAAETYGVLSGFAAMASLDVGTSYVPSDMMAQIHRGEMVIPAFESSMIRSGQATLGGGGGSSSSTAVNLHYNPVFQGGGGSGMAAAVRQSGDDLKTYLWNLTRNGTLKLPGR